MARPDQYLRTVSLDTAAAMHRLTRGLWLFTVQEVQDLLDHTVKRHSHAPKPELHTFSPFPRPLHLLVKPAASKGGPRCSLYVALTTVPCNPDVLKTWLLALSCSLLQSAALSCSLQQSLVVPAISCSLLQSPAALAPCKPPAASPVFSRRVLEES